MAAKGGKKSNKPKVPETRADNVPFFAISAPLAQAIVNYLVAQPYAQVADMIEAMKSLQQVEITEPGTEQVEGE